MNDLGHTLTLSDIKIISKIANRAIPLMVDAGIRREKLDIEMDITAAHEDVGLDLQKLLDADDANFGHDVLGILRFMDRETCKLDGYFLPRCSMSQAEREARKRVTA